MFGTIKNILGKVGLWFKSLLQKHNEHLTAMVNALGPMVISTALRYDLSGEEKKKLIVEKVKAAAEAEGKEIALSVVNEAIEVAANRYKLEIGQLTAEQLDNTLDAILHASKK